MATARFRNTTMKRGNSRGLGTTLTQRAPQLPFAHGLGETKGLAEQRLVRVVERSMIAVEEKETQPFGATEKMRRGRIKSGEVAGAGI